MTIPEACNALAEYFRDNLEYLQKGGKFRIQDVFPDAETAAFVKETLDDLRSEVLRSDVSADIIIGRQEALAFLGQLQRVDCCRKQGRINTLARSMNHKRVLSEEQKGALTLQLQGIGSKVDSEFVADINGPV